MNSDDSPLPPPGPGAQPPAPGETSGPTSAGTPAPGAAQPGAGYPGAPYPGAGYPGTPHPGSSAPGAGPGTSTPWPTPSPSATERIDAFFDSIRRTGIVRSNDRWIGGVASGLALRVGVDALLVRAAFGVLMVLSGVGFVLYAIGWALLPEQNDGRIHLQEAIRGRFDSALAGAGILLLIGLTWRTGQFGWWGGWGFAWFEGLFWTALTIFVIYFFVTVRKQRAGTLPPQPQPPGQTSGRADQAASPSGFSAPGHPATGYPSASGYPTTQPATSPSAFATTAPATGGAAQPQGPGSPVMTTPNMIKTPPPQPAPFRYAGPGAPTPQAGPGYPPKPVSPKASRPPVKGPGAASLGIVVGLALLTFAGLLLADRAGIFDGSDGRIFTTTLGVAAILAGAGIVVAGFRGRSSGVLGFIALVAVFLGPITSFAVGSPLSNGPLVGDETFRPTTSEQAADGFSMGAGDLTIDLTDLQLTADETIEVPIDMAVGNLVVILPEDTPATAKVRLGAGTATWRVGTEDLSRGGVGIRTATFQTSHIGDGDPAQIHLDIQSGAGEILIKEES